MFGFISLAWLQLTHEKTRLLTALAGVAFACILMFLQFGFQDALFDSATLVERKMNADLVLISKKSEAFFAMKSFARRSLYQTLQHKEVAQVMPMYVGLGPWKNPWNGRTRSLLVMGFNPEVSVLDLPGIAENLDFLKQSDTVLFDRNSRAEFGDVPTALGKGAAVSAEVNQRRVDVKGLFTLGASFAADGTIVTSDLNFLRIFKDHRQEAIHVGIIKLQPGTNPLALKTMLQREMPEDVRVLTQAEFVQFEKEYWETGTAIGFIFSLGVAMGFVVGMVIAYQILHSDVANHLAEYATLKAMGYTDRFLIGVVAQEAFLLSAIGYLPGILISWGLYELTKQATFLPMEITLGRAALVLFLTFGMCLASGVLAMRKLRQADPADIF